VTDVHFPGGIQTRNPSNRAAADPCLRPCGYRDRCVCVFVCVDIIPRIFLVVCTTEV